jgi:hypothetical protein
MHNESACMSEVASLPDEKEVRGDIMPNKMFLIAVLLSMVLSPQGIYS